MRVCQPGPVAFHRARTSGGSLREIDVRGAALFGRPRGWSSRFASASPYISGSTSRAGRARRKSSTVHSGLSGSSRYFFGFRLDFITAYLSPVRFAKADDMHPASARGMDQDMQTQSDEPVGLESSLAVVTPDVFNVQRAGPLNIDRPLQRNAMHIDVARILRRVEGNVHEFIVYTLNIMEVSPNQFVFSRNAAPRVPHRTPNTRGRLTSQNKRPR